MIEGPKHGPEMLISLRSLSDLRTLSAVFYVTRLRIERNSKIRRRQKAFERFLSFATDVATRYVFLLISTKSREPVFRVLSFEGALPWWLLPVGPWLASDAQMGSDEAVNDVVPCMTRPVLWLSPRPPRLHGPVGLRGGLSQVSGRAWTRHRQGG